MISLSKLYFYLSKISFSWVKNLPKTGGYLRKTMSFKIASHAAAAAKCNKFKFF